MCLSMLLWAVRRSAVWCSLLWGTSRIPCRPRLQPTCRTALVSLVLKFPLSTNPSALWRVRQAIPPIVLSTVGGIVRMSSLIGRGGRQFSPLTRQVCVVLVSVEVSLWHVLGNVARTLRKTLDSTRPE